MKLSIKCWREEIEGRTVKQAVLIFWQVNGIRYLPEPFLRTGHKTIRLKYPHLNNPKTSSSPTRLATPSINPRRVKSA